MSHPSTNSNILIAAYASGPDQLDSALRELTSEDFDASAEPGSWTIRMIVHHLADGDDLWRLFIKQAMGGMCGEFTLQWYWALPQDEWARRWSYSTRAVAPSQASFRANREQVAQLLESEPRALERTLTVQWPKRESQEISVGWVIEMQTQHVDQHVADITAIRKQHQF